MPATAKPAALVRVTPRDGLRFPPDEVYACDVDAAAAASMVATGAYTADTAPATTTPDTAPVADPMEV